MASKTLDDLIEMFLEDLNDEERQRVINKLEHKEPEIANILRDVWKTQKSNRRLKDIADNIEDMFD